uniref:Uncharacterized protein n=1 Tax=viral metagenome TaxID=1070528 RepID=A0A6C0IJP4_9ZZZZ
MFTSLFKSLGIYSEDKIKVKNADLRQGQAFEHYEHDVTVNTLQRLSFLELTSMPGLMSINEAFNGDDSLLAKNKHTTDTLTQNEADFNKTLSEYSALQNNLSSSALHHNANRSVNDKIMANLAHLNNKLIEKAKNISTDMSNLTVDDANMKNYIERKRAHLNKYIYTLDEQKQQIRNVKDNGSTVSGMGENSKLIRTSNQYHYLMWFIVFITLLCLFMYILTSDLVTNTLSVIIMLMVIFLLARAISTF